MAESNSTKFCGYCQKELARKPNEQVSTFKRRRFCDRICVNLKPIQATKLCNNCGEEKPLEAFRQRPVGKTGRLTPVTPCKACASRQQSERTKQKPRSVRTAIARKWRQTPKGRACTKRVYEKRKAAGLEHNQLRKRTLKIYGLTEAEYNALLEAQGGVCALCGRKQTERGPRHMRNLSIDHDHKTGKVRGLLCANHNLALGLFEDDTELMKRAIQYLADRKEKAS